MEPTPRRLLLTKDEAMQQLGIGEKLFNKLRIPCVQLGRKKKYLPEDIEEFIYRQREQSQKPKRKSSERKPCRSTKGKIRHSTGTTSRSNVVDIEDVLRR